MNTTKWEKEQREYKAHRADQQRLRESADAIGYRELTRFEAAMASKAHNEAYSHLWQVAVHLGANHSSVTKGLEQLQKTDSNAAERVPVFKAVFFIQ